ncbi:hypothetical protein B0A48_00960 [Cryoendolithus antarcticus]|uniref:Vacuolar protein sorting-associated protein 54 n=1 Tax=Cryoendolithus antarcticus TaxID=1507870 RepID=A0A1V8TS02_9PEZI|nr:hypothetical protein B0A48_00960 [Cryoendolithus antarcticus]
MSSNSPRFTIDTSLTASPTTSTPGSPRPNSGYPFPTQASLDRQVSAGRFQSRRGSAASISTVASIGGGLDTSVRRSSTVRETSQNAISTLLQPPIVRTGLIPQTQAAAAAAGFKAPTTRDIPPVTLTNIPHVPPESFRDYLTRIGPLFESFQRGRAEPEQAQWLKKDGELEKADRMAEALERKMSRGGPVSPRLDRQNSSAALSPLESPRDQTRRRSSAQYRRRHEPTPLSTIPPVYFEDQFQLENPRTFDVVSERAEIVRPPPGTPAVEHLAANGTPLPPRKSLATNAILQEKLSWYMDTVEVHLINNISAASTGFFAALGSLKELQTEAEESVAKIQGLREDLRRLDQEVAVGGLEVAAKRRRKQNVQKLGRATRQVQQVVELVKDTDEKVDEGNYEEAADQVDQVERLICGHAAPNAPNSEDLIDLRSLRALQGLDAGMQELQYRIGSGFAVRFTTTLLADLRQHIAKVPPAETLKRWSRQRGIPVTYMETSKDLRDDLLANLKGLSRSGHTAPAIAAFRETAMKEMKSLIRKHLPSSTDDDVDSMVSSSTRGGKQLSQQEKSTILARNLRALDTEDSEKLLVNVYTSVGEALRRLSTQTKVLLDVTSQMQSPPPSRQSMEKSRSPPRSPMLASMDERLTNGGPALTLKMNVQDELSQALDMSSLLGQAVDTAQTQITRVLKVRNEQSVNLPKDDFLRYFTLNRLFADECEAVSGRGGMALRGVINAQISGFVQALGQSETSRVCEALDRDSWNATDVKELDQKALDRIVGAMDKDPPEWTASARPIWEPSLPHANGTSPAALNGTPTPGATNGTSTPQPATKAAATKPAQIDTHRFILVPSALTLLPSIETFLGLTTTLPSLTPALSTALLDVLRAFNSRSSQLILGAGATRIAGLKNITTKHLALSSQALSLVITLVPYIREAIRRHLPSTTANASSVLAEWDKLKRLYQEHQSGIHDKLVEIMTSRSLTHTKTMLALDFDTLPAADTPNAYIETLTRETLTLHRVLSRHLSELDVRLIMSRIFEMYREQWCGAFRAADLDQEVGGRALLKDAEALTERLGRIEGFDKVGSEILGVVKGRVKGLNGGEVLFDKEAESGTEAVKQVAG